MSRVNREDGYNGEQTIALSADLVAKERACCAGLAIAFYLYRAIGI